MSGEEHSQGELQEPFSRVWQPGAGEVNSAMPDGRNTGAGKETREVRKKPWLLLWAAHGKLLCNEKELRRKQQVRVCRRK